MIARMMTTLKSNSVSNTMATRNGGGPTTASVYVIVIVNLSHVYEYL